MGQTEACASPTHTNTMSAVETVQLVAVTPPIEVSRALVRTEPVTLVLRKDLYADAPTDYAITDTNGSTVVTLKAKNHSVTNKRSALRAR